MSPPELLLTDDNQLHDGGGFGVWMRGDVMGIRIVGELNDERNPMWRAKVDALWQSHWAPCFSALDVSEAKRAQTALRDRRARSRIEWGAIRVTEASSRCARGLVPKGERSERIRSQGPALVTNSFLRTGAAPPPRSERRWLAWVGRWRARRFPG